MAAPKKKSRNICVDGTRFRWHAKLQSPHLFISVVHSGISGQHLAVTFDEDRVITPSVVEFIIRSALRDGWRPDELRLPQYLIDGDELVAGTEHNIGHPPNCNWEH